MNRESVWKWGDGTPIIYSNWYVETVTVRRYVEEHVHYYLSIIIYLL